MSNTRKARVPMKEQLRLINECRQSGMTDADWCHENGIAVSTFYNWVSRCRKVAADRIPVPNYGHLDIPQSKPDVVPIDIIPDRSSKQQTAPLIQQTFPDSPHTIEVTMRDVCIRIRNDADLHLLARTLHLIREILC